MRAMPMRRGFSSLTLASLSPSVLTSLTRPLYYPESRRFQRIVTALSRRSLRYQTAIGDDSRKHVVLKQEIAEKRSAGSEFNSFRQLTHEILCNSSAHSLPFTHNISSPFRQIQNHTFLYLTDSLKLYLNLILFTFDIIYLILYEEINFNL